MHIIPKSITLNGVTYSISETPELQSLIQAAAGVEKDKLYSKFDTLKKQVEELQNAQIETTPAQTANQPQNVNIQSLANALKQELAGSFVTKEDMSKAVKEAIQPILNNSEEARKKELSEYRESLIQKNLATCIPELVKGNTKEELDKSLQDSINIRAKYPSPNTPYIPADKHIIDPNLQRQMQNPEFQAPNPAKSPTNAGNQPNNGTAPKAPQVPPMTQQPNPSSKARSARTMNMDEFAKKRNSMLAELESLYGDGTSDSNKL